jgi:hypothetical protein
MKSQTNGDFIRFINLETIDGFTPSLLDAPSALAERALFAILSSSFLTTFLFFTIFLTTGSFFNF